ncbi:CheW protein [Geoalkalibacter ferrihydriticus]|uniref:Chemotaxis protein CheW n=2 Tax=Geoalkalibacter ferrihydriticus TaxID=392333 RepID=A0A0C2E9U8_9BACT|nr:chemotaxis protein CheW [Geoalkalibacter ferrihydriticus]KIH75348.1 chemotaxis protein CheW [Geoalkalibacter ferrihydriticus DSM 17813]SDM98019.1 CheW protein [Geoalkalibacter ferrihydriticus]
MTVSEDGFNETNQYLTFKLDGEIFALGIAKVREVLDYTAITKVPKSPDFMRGVINVRGGVVPVIDLRVKFGMAPTPQTVNTCIIIVEIAMEGETTVLGVLADQVEEVLDLDPAQIEPAPRIGTRLRTEFIQGMGKREEQFIILLDIDRVFSGEELAGVSGGEDLAQSVG